MAQISVVGLLGSHDTTTVLLNRITGIASTRQNAVLPPWVASPFEGLSCFKLHYIPALRALFVQLATPPAPADAAGLAEQSSASCTERKLQFLTAALHLFLSCHAIVWALPSVVLPASFLHQLRLLQAAKQKLDPEKVNFPAWNPKSSKETQQDSAVQLLVAIAAAGREDTHSSTLEFQVKDALRLLAEQSSSRSSLCRAGPQKEGEPHYAFQIPDALTYRHSVLAAALKALAEDPKGAGAGPVTPPALKTAGETEFRLLRESVLAAIKSTQLQPTRLPTLTAWCEKARSLQSILALDFKSASSQQNQVEISEPIRQGSSAGRAALQLLATNFDPPLSFLAKKCERALEAAFAEYKKGQPTRYSAERHKAALLRARQLLKNQAVGGGVEAFAKLVERCDAHWRGGRQLCGAQSLSGNPCILPPHATLDEDPKVEASRSASTGALHDSGIVHAVADVSGTLRLRIADPFIPAELYARQANGLPPEKAVVAALPMRMRLVGQGDRSRDSTPEGDEHESQWAHLTTFDSWEGRSEHLWQWIEGGVTTGSGQLQSLLLPRPAVEAEAAPGSKGAGKAGQQQEGSLNLDLEFPPLLSAKDPSKSGDEPKKRARSGKDQAKREREEAYCSLIQSEWPGTEWQAAEAGQEESTTAQLQFRGKRGTAKPSLDRIALGFEYESLQGTRCLLNPDLVPELSPPPEQLNQLTWLLSNALPVWLRIQHRQDGNGWSSNSGRPPRENPSGQPGKGGKGEWARLARIWVATPPGPLAFGMQPLLRFEVGQTIVEFQLAQSQQLPPGKLSVLHLPMFFAVPSNWLPELQQGRESVTHEGWQALIPSKKIKATLTAGTSLTPL